MIALSKPFFDDNESKAVEAVLKSGWVTQGPKVEQFEKEICNYTGAKFCVAVTNCTSALYLALQALKIGQNDIVLCPSLSFIATANTIVLNGAEPFFIDINPETLNIDENKIEEVIRTYFVEKEGGLFLKTDDKKRLSAMIAVHQVGNPLNIEKLEEINQKYQLPIIEDAACALGSEYSLEDQTVKVGNSPFEIACFSLHPRKIITCGEGGFLTTNSRKLYEKLKLLRHHGMSISDKERHVRKDYVQESYSVVGSNFRLSDIHASIAIEQLEKLSSILEKYKMNFACYRENLKGVKGISLVEGNLFGKPNHQSIVGRCSENPLELINFLKENGISSKRGIMAIHKEKPYRNSFSSPLEETNASASFDIILPNYFLLEKSEIEFIATKIKSFFE